MTKRIFLAIISLHLVSSCSVGGESQLETFIFNSDKIVYSRFLPDAGEEYKKFTSVDMSRILYSENGMSIGEGIHLNENYFYDNTILNRSNILIFEYPESSTVRDIAYESEKILSVLVDNGAILFKRVEIPITRKNTTDVFKKIVREFHVYDQKINNFLVKDKKDIKFPLGERCNFKVTYRKKYNENIYGVNTEMYSFAFTYDLKINDLLGIKEARKHAGMATFAKNVKNGQWELVESKKDDDGKEELLAMLPEQTLTRYWKDNYEEIEKIFWESLHKKEYKEYSFEVINGKKGSSGEYRNFLGLFSSDDIVKINSFPVDGKSLNNRGRIYWHKVKDGLHLDKSYFNYNKDHKPGDDILNAIHDQEVDTWSIDKYFEIKPDNQILNYFFVIDYNKKYEQKIIKQEGYFGFGYAKLEMSSPYGTPFHIKITVLCNDKNHAIDMPTCEERFRKK